MKKTTKRFSPLFPLLVAFMLGYFLVNDLSLRYLYAYAILAAGLMISVFTDGIIRPGMKLKDSVLEVLRRITPMKACFLFLAVVIAVYSFLPNSDRDGRITTTTLSILILATYLCLAVPGEKAIKGGFAAIHVVSLIFSVYIITVGIYPEFYWNYVHPHLGAYTQERALMLMPLGYGVPIGGSTSYSILLITVAFFSSLGKLLLTGGVRKPRQALPTVLVTVLYFVAILMMNRRSELLTLLGVAAVLLVVYLIPQGKEGWKTRVLSLTAVVVLSLLATFLLARGGYLPRYAATLEVLMPEAVTQPIETTAAPTVPSVGETTAVESTVPEINVPKTELSHGRFSLWKKSAELFKEAPITGLGWMQFRQHAQMGEDYVHNTYLQWLTETGVIGFLLIMTPIMFMLFMTFKQTVRMIKAKDQVSFELRRINMTSLAMHGYLLVLNLIDPSFYHLYFFIFYSFVITLADTSLRLEAADYLGGSKTCLIKRIWKNTKLF